MTDQWAHVFQGTLPRGCSGGATGISDPKDAEIARLTDGIAQLQTIVVDWCHNDRDDPAGELICELRERLDAILKTTPRHGGYTG